MFTQFVVGEVFGVGTQSDLRILGILLKLYLHYDLLVSYLVTLTDINIYPTIIILSY